MTDAARVRILTRSVERLRQDREHWRGLFERAPVALLRTDLNGAVTDVNEMARNLLRFDESLFGQPFDDVLGLERRRANQRIRGLLRRAIETDEVVRNRGVLQARGSEQRIFVDVHAASIRDENDQPDAVIVVVEDLTEMRRASERLRFEAEVDALTGMVRRPLFERKLNEAVRQVDSEQSGHVLCYLDLDHFKPINDTAGHQAGDQLLSQLAKGIRSCVRASDVVGRLGGDEFAVLLCNCSLADAMVLAEKIRCWVAEFRFQWGERQFKVSVSIGVAAIERGKTTAQIIEAADSACYAAKSSGRDQVASYSAGLSGEARHGALSWSLRLEQALKYDRLELYHQAVFKPGSEFPRHAEVLLRLSDDGGLFTPDEFLDANSRPELRRDVDRWVLTHLIEGLANSELARPGIDAWFVNVSPASLADESFPHFVIDLLQNTGLVPGELCIEVSEGAALANPGGLRHLTDVVCAQGVRIALDKFAREACSLAHLRNARLNYIKLDESLLGSAINDPQIRVMLRAVIDMAKSCGIEVVATGVGDEEIEAQMARLGVDYLQGVSLEMPAPLRAISFG